MPCIFFIISLSGTSGEAAPSSLSSVSSSSSSWSRTLTRTLKPLLESSSPGSAPATFGDSGRSASSGCGSVATAAASLFSLASHSAIASATVSSFTTTGAESSLTGSSLDDKCSTPTRTSINTLVKRALLAFALSSAAWLSATFFSHASTSCLLPLPLPPENLRSSRLALARHRSSTRASMRDCASFVLLTRLACVCSCVSTF
mmetsp:Transcript_26634/g.58384  ORF Transcript_26634/g.58384 Transcript_26634/m.58384 type:complete len:203 (-) Transcript_26634:1219-1827(-)